MAPEHLKINTDMIEKLSKGRLWVSCNFPSGGCSRFLKKLSAADAVNNIKGAYQEVSMGVYVQPMPKLHEPGNQYRLRKKQILWKIEEYDSFNSTWILRVQQQSQKWWLVMNENRLIQVKIISFQNILGRMMGETFEEDIEKQVNFLYLNCNQRKLNTKLRNRNLKHNIKNLSLQLEKQSNLNFAVRFVNKADEIAKECGIY